MLRIRPCVKMSDPLYDLEKIKKCVREKKPRTITFPAEKRSVKAVIKVFKEKDNRDMSDVEARDYILARISMLKKTDFSHHGEFGEDYADVYGRVFEGENWYIKLDYDDESGVLREISFHPAIDKIYLANGKEVEKGKCTTWES